MAGGPSLPLLVFSLIALVLPSSAVAVSEVMRNLVSKEDSGARATRSYSSSSHEIEPLA